MLGKLKRLLFRTHVDGEFIPDWYGVAYTDWISRRVVLCPIPLNVAVRVWRNVKAWGQHNGYCHFRMGDAFSQGFRKGYAEGFTTAVSLESCNRYHDNAPVLQLLEFAMDAESCEEMTGLPASECIILAHHILLDDLSDEDLAKLAAYRERVAA